VAGALAHVGEQKEIAGVLSTAFGSARFSGREFVFIVFQAAIDILIKINKGTMIAELYRAVDEVDGWWR
jgi:hypothetical protein